MSCVEKQFIVKSKYLTKSKSWWSYSFDNNSLKCYKIVPLTIGAQASLYICPAEAFQINIKIYGLGIGTEMNSSNLSLQLIKKEII